MKRARVALVFVLSACGGKTQLEGPAPVADGETEAGMPRPERSMSVCWPMGENGGERSCSQICVNEDKTCRDDCRTEQGPVAVTCYPDNASCEQGASYEYGHKCDQAFGAVNRGRVVTYARCCCR